MIEFNGMLLRRLSKNTRFTGKAGAPRGLVFNQSLIVDWPPALFAHTVEYLRPRACIYKEGRRMFRVGKPVNSLLSFLTLRTNIMTIQTKKTVQELKPPFAGIDVGAEELILVIRKSGTPYKPQKFANTPADRARLVKKLVNLPGK